MSWPPVSGKLAPTIVGVALPPMVARMLTEPLLSPQSEGVPW